MQTRLMVASDFDKNLIGLKVSHRNKTSSRFGWEGRIVNQLTSAEHSTFGKPEAAVVVKFRNDTLQEYSAWWACQYLQIEIIKEQEMSDVKRGYIVWCPNGTSCPRVVHPTKQEAQKEAQRLAASLPSNRFYVAKLESVSSTQQVVTTNL